jgi:hypothetical protein
MKRIISMLLILTTLFTTLAVNVSAARTEEYVSEVALIYEDSVEEARKAIEGTDWKLFEQDLNANADYMIDDGVYLIYKTSTNVEDAITDLRVMDMYGGFSISNYQKQLEESRKAYKEIAADIRIVANEFKALYEAGDEMALLAYRQMNLYKDISETEMRMCDFFLNIPSDDALVMVMMQGNSRVFENLVILLALGISRANEATLSERIAEKYANKDALTDIEYHDDAVELAKQFETLYATIKRYETLKLEHNYEDEDITEAEAQLLMEGGATARLLETIPYGNGSLKDFILLHNWTTVDLYPIVAAMTEGQKILSFMNLFEYVLQYSSSNKSIEELNKMVDEIEDSMAKENDGTIKPIDVYLGVDRSLFEGNFAFTTAAQRQQAITGYEYMLDQTLGDTGLQVATYTLLGLSVISASAPLFAKALVVNVLVPLGKKIAVEAVVTGVEVVNVPMKLSGFFTYKIAGHPYIFYGVALGLALIAIGTVAINIWYDYYNPEYTAIPDTIVDVRATDLGDKYIKYTSAEVFGEEDMNADFNAYQGKEWIALYYTKDANAGNCLTPYFVFKDNDNSIARRHQGVSMFGEDKAFNLNSHVFNGDAKGAYLTVRYSTAKKAAADVPTVVGSMLAQGAFYALTALAGAGIGVGGTVLLQNAKKKKKETELAPEDSN